MRRGAVAATLVSALSISTALLAPPAMAAPPSPTGLAAESRSEAGTLRTEAVVAVSWVDGRTGAAGAAVAYGVVGSAEGETSRSGSNPVCSLGTCTSLVSDLSGGVSYEFVVVAIAADNSRTSSAALRFTALSVPAAPTLEAPVAGEAAATLSWAAPTGASTGGLAISSYRVTDTQNRVDQVVAGDQTSVEIAELDAGASYTFRIVATNGLGVSSTATFTPVVPIGTPDAPAAPNVSVAGADLSVSWSAPLADGGSPITGYELTLLRSGVQAGGIVEKSAGSTTHVFTGLTNGTYTVRVAAVNLAGAGPRSVPSTSAAVTAGVALAANAPIFNPATLPTVVVGDIQQFTVTNPGNTQITISVSAVPAGACVPFGASVRAIASGTCTVTASSAASVTHDTGSTTKIFTISSGGGGSVGGGVAAPVGLLVPNLSPPTLTRTAGTNTLVGSVGTWQDQSRYSFQYFWYACSQRVAAAAAALPTNGSCALIQGANALEYTPGVATQDKHIVFSLVLSGTTLSGQAVNQVYFSASFAPLVPGADSGALNGWTKRMVSATGTPTAEVKFYAKNPIGAGKVQFMLNGREIAWIRAIDGTDPKLRTVTAGPMAGVSYLVRTITLAPGKNALEIYVNGERVRRVAYGR